MGPDCGLIGSCEMVRLALGSFALPPSAQSSPQPPSPGLQCCPCPACSFPSPIAQFAKCLPARYLGTLNLVGSGSSCLSCCQPATLLCAWCTCMCAYSTCRVSPVPSLARLALMGIQGPCRQLRSSGLKRSLRAFQCS